MSKKEVNPDEYISVAQFAKENNLQLKSAFKVSDLQSEKFTDSIPATFLYKRKWLKTLSVSHFKEAPSKKNKPTSQFKHVVMWVGENIILAEISTKSAFVNKFLNQMRQEHEADEEDFEDMEVRDIEIEKKEFNAIIDLVNLRKRSTNKEEIKPLGTSDIDLLTKSERLIILDEEWAINYVLEVANGQDSLPVEKKEKRL
jgi:hypothetical protein